MTNHEPGIVVEVANEQSLLEVDEPPIRRAVTQILEDAGYRRGLVSVALVEDQTIARLHAEYLGHQGPTDVLSFLLEGGEGWLEGEVVASAERAVDVARLYGWPPEHELLLYAVHGTLHLVGYRDETPEQQAEMRRQEGLYLGRVGIEAGRTRTDAVGRGDRGGERTA